jgi:hypothetical protein
MPPRLALVDVVRERVRLEPAAQRRGGHLCERRRPPGLIIGACHRARIGVAGHAEDSRHAARRHVGKQQREQRLHRRGVAAQIRDAFCGAQTVAAVQFYSQFDVHENLTWNSHRVLTPGARTPTTRSRRAEVDRDAAAVAARLSALVQRGDERCPRTVG